MALIIEGIDGSGKSTLIRALSGLLNQFHRGAQPFVQESEGPPKHPGEMNERIRRYNSFTQGVIFDRHPCISNPIYDAMRLYEDKPIDPIDPALIEMFYDQKHLLVYCEPVMFKHDVKPGECPDHVANVEKHYNLMLGLYRGWALRHAHMIYRIGDDPHIVYHQAFT